MHYLWITTGLRCIAYKSHPGKLTLSAHSSSEQSQPDCSSDAAGVRIFFSVMLSNYIFRACLEPLLMQVISCVKCSDNLPKYDASEWFCSSSFPTAFPLFCFIKIFFCCCHICKVSVIPVRRNMLSVHDPCHGWICSIAAKVVAGIPR